MYRRLQRLHVIEGVASVDIERCIGCGLCVTTCSAEAIRMVPRVKAAELPLSASAMGIKVATEKGRIDDFAKFMTR